MIYGHRGARGEMPENSFAGLRHLLETGVQAVEIDVQNTSDGVTVLWHDPVLNPDMVRGPTGQWLTCDATQIIATPYKELTQYEIGALRTGSAQAQRFPQQAKIDGERIATLRDVCRWAQSLPGFILNIEVKSYADRSDLGASPDVLARSVASLVQEFGLTDRSIVSSFDWRLLTALHQLAPAVPRGYLSYLDRPNPPMQPNIIDSSAWMDGVRLADHDGSLPQAIADIGGAVWAPYFEDLTREDMNRAHAAGLKVNVWTVNEPQDMQRMAKMGVDGLITDYPTRAQALFAPGTQSADAVGKPKSSDEVVARGDV
tara:strand:+ start:3393 stop:4337 length:945 start_codon:yes stop_codon:yes gene_type:complete